MQKRITIFDTVRGFTMISMAGFHACYDLAYLYDWDMPWFTQTVFQDIWRASISWVCLFQATIFQSSRSYSCISQDTLLRAPLKDANIPPQAGPTPTPCRRSPALDVMHSPFICYISPSYWAFWSSPTRCDNARAAVQYEPAVSPQYERHPQDIPRAKGSPAHARL